MSSTGVSSSKITTRSTEASEASTEARAASFCTGRPGPLRRATEASLLSPPPAGRRPLRACARSETWPGWSRSKQPLVKPTLQAVAPPARDMVERHGQRQHLAALRACRARAAPRRIPWLRRRRCRPCRRRCRRRRWRGRGVEQRGAAAERRGQRRHHRVAGARDVVDLARLGRQAVHLVRWLDQHHAVLAAGDQHGAEAVPLHLLERGGHDLVVAVERPPAAGASSRRLGLRSWRRDRSNSRRPWDRRSPCVRRRARP